VSVVNPAQIRAYGQSELSRTKTDKTDAALIARFCQSHHPQAWTPPAPEVRELQALLRRLESLQEMRQMEVNRLASGVSTAAVTDSLQESITFLDGEIRKIEQSIRAHIERHPHLKEQSELLQSIHGIGPKTALFLLAELPEVQRFGSAREMAAFAGVTPHRRESGKSVHGRSHLSKIGSARIRKALYWPAISAMHHNPIVRAFCDRLRARGKSEMSLIGAAMRKLIHLAYGVLKTNHPFDPNYSGT
jgi:transposase